MRMQLVTAARESVTRTGLGGAAQAPSLPVDAVRVAVPRFQHPALAGKNEEPTRRWLLHCRRTYVSSIDLIHGQQQLSGYL